MSLLGFNKSVITAVFICIGMMEPAFLSVFC